MRDLLALMLADDESMQVEVAAGAAETHAAFARQAFDVVITDLNMPDGDGLSLMQWSQEQGFTATWIVLTGHGTLDRAVKALQLGAFDFIAKPIHAPEGVRSAVRNALAHRRLTRERDRLVGQLADSNRQLQDHVDQLEEACRLLRHQAEMIRADLHRAGAIQRSLLPEQAPDFADFHVQALYRPTQNVGGDLYDVIRIDDRHVALLIADAAGHGLSAAMLAVHFRSQLRLVDPATRVANSPAEVLRAVNRSLCESLLAPGLFLTAAYCLLDTELRDVTIASAGHPPVLRMSRQGEVERFRHTGPALGLHPDAEFTQHHVRLAAGDGLLFYSDGLYDCIPEGGDDSVGRILAALESGTAADGWSIEALKQCCDGVAGQGAQRLDDVTVLMLATTPGLSSFDNGSLQSFEGVAQEALDLQTLVGSDADRVTFSIRGRGDWTQSAAFHIECNAAIEKGADLMLDLSECAQLDSTFLGTIHQLCGLADAAGVEFRLQGVLPSVEDLFLELGMHTVMDHIVPRMLPLPSEMGPVTRADLDPPTRALLLLRAHEGLAALNDRNRAEFDPVLTQLRREFAVLTRAASAPPGSTTGR
jgi:serine phosphatase RsbU (regulator of sigma subunit)/anti-anti-sigma regulatory factor